MEFFVVILAAFAGGLVQTVSGFGGSLVIMLFLPVILPLMSAITLNQTIVLALDISLIITYWKHIRLNRILLPAISCVLFTTVFTNLSAGLDVSLMKLLFGLFLIGVSIYFWFFSQKVQGKDSPWMALGCGALSGTTNGLFGIGGPPIAVYYLAVSDSKESYIGTTQLFFFFTTVYTIGLRLYRGLINDGFWTMAFAGIAAILAGKFVGKRIVDRISAETMKKCVYVCLFATGVVTVFQSL